MNTYAWHDWFAWRPVLTTTSEVRWLVFVERRLKYFGLAGLDHQYEYRDISGRLGERLMPASC